MNKKITTLMLATIILLIGKVNGATLTQYIGENYITQAINEGQQVRMRFVNQIGYTFKNWIVESGNISIDTTNASITFTMPATNVTIRSNYAEEVVTPQGKLLSEVATVGAYVTYVPSSQKYTVPTTVSGYDSDQPYTPSNTTSWRVFSNSEGNVEIISTDSVGTLYLQGDTGYINAVQTLNDMSAAYVNTELATSGRSLGYYDVTRYTSTSNGGSAMTETELTNYKTINTSSYSLNHIKSGFPYIDYQYMPDKTALADHGSMYHSSEYVWLASRAMFDGSNGSRFFEVGRMDTSGGVDSTLVCLLVAGTTPFSKGNGVRPVVSLKYGITIAGGSGTFDDPYVINATNSLQHTITYCANGGYGEMVPQSVAQGSSVTLTPNAYAHHSKTFAGWSTSSTATTVTYVNGATITPEDDMTLYAIWQ